MLTESLLQGSWSHFTFKTSTRAVISASPTSTRHRKPQIFLSVAKELKKRNISVGGPTNLLSLIVQILS